MNICYWNVCNETPPGELVEACVELKKQGEIDVFCLQEVPYQLGAVAVPASEAIGKTLGMMSAFEHTRTLPSTPEQIKGYGTAILANGLHSVRIDVLRTDSLAYLTPGFGNKRVLLSAKTYERPNVTVGVAHLSYKLPVGIGKGALLKERLDLAEHLTNYRLKSEVVFGGDMNCGPGVGLDDILLRAGFYGLEAGCPTFRSRHWFAGHAERDLDRVFVTKGIFATAELGNFGPSDHKPIIARIE